MAQICQYRIQGRRHVNVYSRGYRRWVARELGINVNTYIHGCPGLKSSSKHSLFVVAAAISSRRCFELRALKKRIKDLKKKMNS